MRSRRIESMDRFKNVQVRKQSKQKPPSTVNTRIWRAWRGAFTRSNRDGKGYSQSISIHIGLRLQSVRAVKKKGFLNLDINVNI